MDDQLQQYEAARIAIVRQLYQLLGTSDRARYAMDIANTANLPYEVIEHVTGELLVENLTTLSDDGFGSRGLGLRIAPDGIRAAEQNGWVGPERARAREEATLAMLRYLGDLFKVHGRSRRATRPELVQVGGDNGEAEGAFIILMDEDLIEDGPFIGARYCISPSGRQRLAAVQEQEQAVDRITRRFAEIRDLPAQQKGRELEKLLGEVLRHQGCHCEVDVRSPGEQNDLIVRCGPFYYICECKWEKSPAEADVVTEMSGRVLKRPAQCVGVVFAMSGFTSGAREAASTPVHGCAVLLIGGEDLMAMIRGERLFRDLVEERLLCLAMRHVQ